jgi:hypothetical protein
MPGDVQELRQEVQALGLDYPHAEVCESADITTGQHVAVLSKRPPDNHLSTRGRRAALIWARP